MILELVFCCANSTLIFKVLLFSSALKDVSPSFNLSLINLWCTELKTLGVFIHELYSLSNSSTVSLLTLPYSSIRTLDEVRLFDHSSFILRLILDKLVLTILKVALPSLSKEYIKNSIVKACLPIVVVNWFLTSELDSFNLLISIGSQGCLFLLTSSISIIMLKSTGASANKDWTISYTVSKST